MSDVVCTSGPSDRPFEERHARVSVAMVVSGSFSYRAPGGRAVMSAGSIMLGNAGECYECGHEHASGDRCVAFHYTPEFFERIAVDAEVPRAARRFARIRIPPVQGSAGLVAPVMAGLVDPDRISWEQAAVEVAAATLRLAAGLPMLRSTAPAGAAARVTESVRRIEAEPDKRWSLTQLAADAGQSPFHFLRSFTQVTGVTPHQFVRRARLREAAARLAGEQKKVIEIALDAGFTDLSAFNRAFRSEFGTAPERYRAHVGRR
ncbi:MAG: AraC family transcriptional regulator [Gemmatimonadaceae bacterium]|nr:AraC family transcriptional regulator [Gemmatimonadaceae bacterium]